MDVLNTISTKKAAGININGILKKIIPVAAGSIGTAGALDAIQNHGDYSNFDAGRLSNMGLNALLGGAGGHLISEGVHGVNPHGVVEGIGSIGAAPVKDMALNVATAARDASNYMKNPHDSSGFTPIQRNLMIGGGAVGLAAAIPALLNISSAAKRIGSGHAVRVSTSVRHNKNHNDDPTDTADIEVAPAAPVVEEPKPSLLARLLHLK